MKAVVKRIVLLAGVLGLSHLSVAQSWLENDMHGSFGMGLGGGFMWIFWILILALIIWAVRFASSRNDDETSHRSPREVLDERFARGEIEEDEYRRRRQELER